MAISTAAAIIGSSLLGAGTALYGASQQKKAAKQGLEAQTQANDRALEEQRRAREMAVGLNEPFRQGGLSAFDALLREYGLAPSGGQPAPQPQYGQPMGGVGSGGGVSPFADMTPEQRAQLRYMESGGGQAPSGGPDFGGYVDAHPDLTAEWGRIGGQDPRFPTKEAYGAWHQQQYGAAEPWRQVPMTQPAPTTPAPATGKGSGAPQINYGEQPRPGTELITAPRPEVGPAPTFERRPDIPAPTYQRPDQPTYTAPGAMPEFRFDPASLRDDPGFRFLLDETADNVNSNFAARGMLRSGGALKALQERSMGVADQYLGNIFNRALQGYQTNANQRNTDRAFGYNVFSDQRDNLHRNAETDYGFATDAFRFGVNRGDQNFENDRTVARDDYRFGVNRGDQNFNTDRNFQRGERDTRVGNLFDLAGFGMRAAGNVSGAAQNFADSASNIYGSRANAQSDAAFSRGQANAGLAGTIGGIGANIFNSASFGRTTPLTAQGHVQPVQFQNPFKLPDYNSLSRLPTGISF